MFEMLLNPKRAERHPAEMFLVGLVYASLSILLVRWIFAKDIVLSNYSGILIVTFTVMFSLPFMYYAIKNEEQKDLETSGFMRLLLEHRRALLMFMWLFMGFIVAYSFWSILFSGSGILDAQVSVYCQINRPSQSAFQNCLEQYGVGGFKKTTGFITSKEKVFMIFANNIYVLIFTLLFSLIFGAGAIFILAWNASVIAAAVGIFTQSNLKNLPLGLARYLIHGIPEIAAYFIGALAGGILSVAIIRRDMAKGKFWDIMQDSLNLIILAVVMLLIAALIEVFVTPVLF
ncbi:stage II sporulation protein M [Candidatus Pacearchaeota archaeon]|nr:stage II sporulation protein M [Candidatus Pacearchaeota archaeon]